MAIGYALKTGQAVFDFRIPGLTKMAVSGLLFFPVFLIYSVPPRESLAKCFIDRVNHQQGLA